MAHALYSRRRASLAIAATFGASIASACIRATQSPGNRIVATPAIPDDDRLKPRNWKMTEVKIGDGVDALAALHFIQDLQLPTPTIPYLTSMTFYAPTEVPVVTVGLYYERTPDNRPVRDALTGYAFQLQQIADLDSPFTFDANGVPAADNLNGGQLDWFSENRQSIVNAMRDSAEGQALSARFDCDFTTRQRPPTSTPTALVVTRENASTLQLDYTVIGCRIVFVG